MPASTFIMKLAFCVPALFSIITPTLAVPYQLSQSYSGATFFNNFNFITSDPSGGWVTYVDQGTAQSLGYARASAAGAYLGVDSTNVYNPSGAGRASVRIESKQSFNKGLFIGDFQHMPFGCGTWPAFWMYGPNWPNSGEIDIIEGVNTQPVNQISGHTNPGCTIAGTRAMGQMYQNVCYQADNSGCYFRARGAFSYGQKFNSIGGGVYAMQWTDDFISVWHWPRGRIPANVQEQIPDPATWGRPTAIFSGSGCNVDQHFNNMKIVLNTDFCGGWAQGDWAGCPGSSCIDYVAANPGAFANAYWQVNSINIYQTQYTPAAVVKGNDTNTSPSQAGEPASSVVPLASILPDYTAPADAMGGTVAPVVGPAPPVTTFLPLSGAAPTATAAPSA